MVRWVYVVVFLFLVSFVYAETNGCCQVTTSGDSCVYTSESNCADANYFSSGALCENTNECSTGCCVISEGCFEGTGEYTCSLSSGIFYDGQECSGVSECEMTCCKFGSDYSFIYSGECQGLIDEYGSEIESISVDTEAECEEFEDLEEKGCCVSTSGCSYVTQEECGVSSYDASGFGFFENEYCDGVAAYLAEKDYEAKDYCDCELVEGNACDEDLMNIVEVDSCGNYGAVVEECDFPDEMCTVGEGGASCSIGECFFDLPEMLEKYNPLWENEFQNYESRCLYEGPAGNYQDRPGSRHYVIRCVVGELILEPCDDLRGTVCVDDYLDGFDWANCVDNNVEDVEGDVTTVPIGEKFWEYYTSGEVSEACSKAVVNCDVAFGKTSGVDFQRECDGNCFCLRKEWSMLMAEYCNAGGDCGNDVNLVEGFSDGNFEMNRETMSVGGNFLADTTSVGCGDGCTDEAITADDARGIQCYDENMDCTFFTWDKISEDYMESLKIRKTGFIGFFTFLEYVNVDPDFLSLVTEYDVKDDVSYEIIGYWELIWYLSEPYYLEFFGGSAHGQCGETMGYFKMASNPQENWVETINFLVDSCDFVSIDFEELVILGEALVYENIVFDAEDSTRSSLIDAPEFESKDDFIPVTISSSCGSWIAPATDDCELCDVGWSEGGIAIEDENGEVFENYECSEYRCRSLGRDCQWIEGNLGTGRANCINAPVDTTPPVISLWEEEMVLENYEYTEDDDKTVIVNAPVGLMHLPVLTDDFSRCKISDDPQTELYTSLEDKETFYDSLDYLVEDPLLGYSQEHNFTYFIGDGATEYNFYVWCENFNDLPTPTFYMFEVTTTSEPDTDAPEIEGIYPNSGSYVKADGTSVDVTLYLNENAYCKYSNGDIDYSLMTSEFLSCAESDGIFDYVCITTIPLSAGMTSLYIKCSDTSGNIMSIAENWYVSQSLPLLIVQTSPTGTLYSNEVVLQVKTEDGADNGNAVCYYEGAGSVKQEMFVSSGTYHEQPLNLEKGSYVYTINCEDSLGNSATSEINFVVDKDESAAEITGVYYLGTNVYVLTNEATSCQYKTESFSYGNGYDMGGVASTAHSFTVSDLTLDYYINCIDAYANTLEGVKINLGYLIE